MIDANQMNFLMIGSLIQILMAASMIRLIVNQKLYILTPPTAILTVTILINYLSLDYQYNQADSPEGYEKCFKENNVYTFPPLCMKDNPITITLVFTILNFWFQLSFVVSMTPFLWIYRFYIMFLYYVLLAVSIIAVQLALRNAECNGGTYDNHNSMLRFNRSMEILVSTAITLEFVFQMFRRRRCCFK